jgi:hypothetical protein
MFLLGKPLRSWVEYITMDLRETGWEDIDWIGLVEVRDREGGLVKPIMNIRIPQNFGKLLSSCTLAAYQKEFSSIRFYYYYYYYC